jgi:uncharacterized membrane protein
MWGMREPQEQLLFNAVLAPNRSLSAKGFRLLMLVLGLASLIPGVIFIANGAWPVSGFLGLDFLAVYLAFRLSYAQSAAREYVSVTQAQLVIERVDPKGHKRAETFPAYWARVSMADPPAHDSQLQIHSHGRQAVLGTFLAPEERLSLARALSEALARARSPQTGA